MKTRLLAGKHISEIGMGCMNVSHAYSGKLNEKDAIALLRGAFDLGINHFDTAALYGFGENEKIVGHAIKPFRDNVFLASKCGMTGVDGKRVIDGRPETLNKTLDSALRSLQTDFIDLYYLHRIDANVPVEESINALSKAVAAGKIGAIGLSEVSAATLARAHAVHPIAAVQTEYSLWTRNAEIAVLDACDKRGITFVGFSPLARGFLCNTFASTDELDAADIRRGMPRFQGENWQHNRQLYTQFSLLAKQAGCTPAQLAIKWVLTRGDFVHALPGTRLLSHLKENVAASTLVLPNDILEKASSLINYNTVMGARYPPPAQSDIDTEEFA